MTEIIENLKPVFTKPFYCKNVEKTLAFKPEMNRHKQ